MTDVAENLISVLPKARLIASKGRLRLSTVGNTYTKLYPLPSRRLAKRTSTSEVDLRPTRRSFIDPRNTSKSAFKETPSLFRTIPHVEREKMNEISFHEAPQYFPVSNQEMIIHQQSALQNRRSNPELAVIQTPLDFHHREVLENDVYSLQPLIQDKHFQVPRSFKTVDPVDPDHEKDHPHKRARYGQSPAYIDQHDVTYTMRDYVFNRPAKNSQEYIMNETIKEPYEETELQYPQHIQSNNEEYWNEHWYSNLDNYYRSNENR